MENLDRLIAACEAAREDYEKGKKGNKSATARVRKQMQDVKKIAQDIRQEMLDARVQGDAGSSVPPTS